MLSLKLVSFNARDVSLLDESGSDEGLGPRSGGDKEFRVQMFGLDESGATYSVDVTGFTPYFYVCVPDDWQSSCTTTICRAMETAVDARYFANTIVSAKLIQRRKLYGFDAGKKSKFVRLNFCSEQAKNKFKGLWYDRNRKLIPFNCCGKASELCSRRISRLSCDYSIAETLVHQGGFGFRRGQSRRSDVLGKQQAALRSSLLINAGFYQTPISRSQSHTRL